MTTDRMTRLRLLDLDMLDARELQRALPEGSCAIEQEPVRPGEHGSLGLTAAVALALSPLVLQAITAWLLKKRQRGSIVLTVEKIGPDNSAERCTLEIKLSRSEAPQAEVLKQLVSGMKLDPDIVTAIAGKV